MSELKSGAAEQALGEHLAAVRGASPEPGTLYHETITEFRQELVMSSLMWDKMHKPHWDATTAWVAARREAPPGQEPERPAQAVFDASAAGMMASSYAYTLAAVIAIAQKRYGDEVAQRLASAADDILMNGDFENVNADVTPEGEGMPGVTQGIELVLGAQEPQS